MFSKKLATALLVGNASAAQAVDAKTVELLVTGLLQGAIDAEGFGDITTCIKDGGKVVEDAELVVADFKQGTTTSYIAGVGELGTLFSDLAAAAQGCAATKQDLQKIEDMAALFKSPKDLAIQVYKDLLLYGTDIFAEIEKAVADYSKSEWQDMGYQLGHAGALVLFGRRAQEELRTARLMQGVTGPFGAQLTVSEAFQCTAGSEAADAFDQAFAEAVAAVETKTPKKRIPALIKSLDAVRRAENELAACTTLDRSSWDFALLDHHLADLNEQKGMHVEGETLYIGGKDIMPQFYRSVGAYLEGDLKTAGTILGQIIRDSQPKISANLQGITVDDLKAMALGYFSEISFGAEADILNFIACFSWWVLAVGTVNEIAGDITDGIASGSWFLVFKGIMLFIGLFVTVDYEAKCLNHGDTTTFFKIQKMLLDPLRNLRIRGTDLVLNNHVINPYLATVAADWKAKNYKKFGSDFAKTFVFALGETQEPLFLF